MYIYVPNTYSVEGLRSLLYVSIYKVCYKMYGEVTITTVTSCSHYDYNKKKVPDDLGRTVEILHECFLRCRLFFNSLLLVKVKGTDFSRFLINSSLMRSQIYDILVEGIGVGHEFMSVQYFYFDDEPILRNINL